MNTKTMNHQTYLMIRENHAIIGELMTTALRVLAERHEPVARVTSLMTEIKDRVAERFQEEVDNGLFTNLTSLAPRLQHEVGTLSSDHARLLQLLEEIRQSAQSDSLSPSEWEALELRFHEFSAEFEQHETREQDLVLEAYDDDIGTGD